MGPPGVWSCAMLALLSLLAISFVGSVLWIVSTEVTASIYGGNGWNPLAVGAVCSLGQNAMYVILYFFGRRLIKKWAWLGRQVGRAYSLWRPQLEKAYLGTTFVGSLLGVPPVVAMVSLASGFGFRLQMILAMTLPGRFIRFTVLAWAGDYIFEWWAAL